MKKSDLDAESVLVDAIAGALAVSAKIGVLELAGAVVALQRRITRLEAREVPRYCGVWDAALKYAPSSMVTDHGSIFIAKAETMGVRPGTSDAWALAVKRGRDGRDTLPKVMR